MNYLGHLALSAGLPSPLMQLGNFLGDQFRGPIGLDWPPDLQAGVALHRHIDAAVDQLPAHRRSQQRLSAALGRYRAPLVDVIYDHLLARDCEAFTGQQLSTLAQWGYDLIADQSDQLPQPSPVVGWVQSDWLCGYAELTGLQRAVMGLSRRARYPVDLRSAMDDFTQSQAAFRADLAELMPLIQQFTQTAVK